LERDSTADPLAPYWHFICTLLVEKLGGSATIEVANLAMAGKRMRYHLEVPAGITGNVRIDAQAVGKIHFELIRTN
jgi:hypothetical protein